MFFSIGCNDDEDDNDDLIPFSKEAILGHWKIDFLENIQTITTTNYTNRSPNGTETSQEFTSTNTFLNLEDYPSLFQLM